jgi:predicted nuclease with RNAse H fold
MAKRARNRRGSRGRNVERLDSRSCGHGAGKRPLTKLARFTCPHDRENPKTSPVAPTATVPSYGAPFPENGAPFLWPRGLISGPTSPTRCLWFGPWRKWLWSHTFGEKSGSISASLLARPDRPHAAVAIHRPWGRDRRSHMTRTRGGVACVAVCSGNEPSSVHARGVAWGRVTHKKFRLGVDPGGEGNFGLAILKADGTCHTCTVDHVDAAVDTISKHVGSVPGGIGVDAPLWWTSGGGGLRKADRWIRDKYGLHHRHVQAVNSLWGSVLAQGIMLVARMREVFPDVNVTETHPKAVLKALGREPWTAYFAALPTDLTLDSKPDHERDAVISAVAAREGFEGQRTKSLHALACTRSLLLACLSQRDLRTGICILVDHYDGTTRLLFALRGPKAGLVDLLYRHRSGRHAQAVRSSSNPANQRSNDAP